MRNEAQYLEQTLQSVAAQTHLPVRWIIVSDGSTDETDNLASRFAERTPFVRFLPRRADAQRSFASKARALRAAVEQLRGVPYALIGNLDGDVSFAPEYFAILAERLRADPQLGIAGGHCYDRCGRGWRKQIVSADYSVAGPIQLFRRECFEAIGGYLPLVHGGIDGVAEGMARMNGWKVRTYTDLIVRHHRPVGTEGRSALRAAFDMGWKEGAIGYDPIFELARAANRLRASPKIVGGALHLAGYWCARAAAKPSEVPRDFLAFLRREQRSRLRKLIGL